MYPLLNAQVSTPVRSRILALTFITFISPLWLTQVAFAQESEKKAIVELLGTTWPQAVIDQDTTAISQLLDVDFEKVDDLGNWTDKNGEIKQSISKLFAPDSVIVEVTKIRFMGIKHAHAVARSIEISNNEEGRYSTSYWSSHLVERRGRSWVVLSSHVSGKKISRPSKLPENF